MNLLVLPHPGKTAVIDQVYVDFAQEYSIITVFSIKGPNKQSGRAAFFLSYALLLFSGDG